MWRSYWLIFRRNGAHYRTRGVKRSMTVVSEFETKFGKCLIWVRPILAVNDGQRWQGLACGELGSSGDFSPDLFKGLSLVVQLVGVEVCRGSGKNNKQPQLSLSTQWQFTASHGGSTLNSRWVGVLCHGDSGHTLSWLLGGPMAAKRAWKFKYGRMSFTGPSMASGGFRFILSGVGCRPSSRHHCFGALPRMEMKKKESTYVRSRE